MILVTKNYMSDKKWYEWQKMIWVTKNDEWQKIIWVTKNDMSDKKWCQWQKLYQWQKMISGWVRINTSCPNTGGRRGQQLKPKSAKIK
jgi:dihydroorotate dehydrogenase